MNTVELDVHRLEMQQRKAYYDIGDIPTNKLPNVFFEPKVVWEVLAADLSLSPIYPAAKGALLFSFLPSLLSLPLPEASADGGFCGQVSPVMAPAVSPCVSRGSSGSGTTRTRSRVPSRNRCVSFASLFSPLSFHFR